MCLAEMDGRHTIHGERGSGITGRHTRLANKEEWQEEMRVHRKARQCEQPASPGSLFFSFSASHPVPPLPCFSDDVSCPVFFLPTSPESHLRRRDPVPEWLWSVCGKALCITRQVRTVV